MIKLGEHFRRDDRSRHSGQFQQKRWFIKARQDQERRDVLEDRAEANFTAFATAVVVATQIEIEEFTARLDTYDEATVKALMENQETLDLINDQLSKMLERAYVMEDGRRLFKTEDGMQVFDETGQEVTRGELDFDLITPDMPSWESYQPILTESQRLNAERDQILEFQGKVDAAREKVADVKMTKDDLDDLDAELADAVPPSVKAHLPEGMNPAVNAPDVRGEFSAQADPATLPKTGATLTAAPAPGM